jgi:L-cysteine S-thiosulfotransferase
MKSASGPHPWRVCAPVLLLLQIWAQGAALAQSQTINSVSPYEVAGDGIAQALNGLTGNAQRGRDIVASRKLGLCLLCHSGPIPEERFQGTLAPDLQGTGSRWSAAQLRLRLVDSRRVNAQSIMPAYHRTTGLTRVGPAWRNQPLLNAQQIEDVLAFLITLRD